MKFKIEHRYSGKILFADDVGSLKLCVEAAVKNGANLEGANLEGANLGGANLGHCNLGRANLWHCNLGHCNLEGANLEGANLGHCNLGRANLWHCNLGHCNLEGANLGGANLGGANWCGATIDGMRVAPGDIGGPGHILWALTNEEEAAIRKMRSPATEDESCKEAKNTTKTHATAYVRSAAWDVRAAAGAAAAAVARAALGAARGQPSIRFGTQQS